MNKYNKYILPILTLAMVMFPLIEIPSFATPTLPSILQIKAGVSCSTAISTCSATFDSNILAGSEIAVFITTGQATNNLVISSVSDTVSNVYTQKNSIGATAFTCITGYMYANFFTAPNKFDGSDQVTVHYSNTLGSTTTYLTLYELSYVSDSPLSVIGSGSGTSVVTSNVGYNNRDILLAATLADLPACGTTVSAGTGFTPDNAAAVFTLAEHKVSTSASTTNFPFGTTGTVQYVDIGAVFQQPTATTSTVITTTTLVVGGFTKAIVIVPSTFVSFILHDIEVAGSAIPSSFSKFITETLHFNEVLANAGKGLGIVGRFAEKFAFGYSIIGSNNAFGALMKIVDSFNLRDLQCIIAFSCQFNNVIVPPTTTDYVLSDTPTDFFLTAIAFPIAIILAAVYASKRGFNISEDMVLPIVLFTVLMIAWGGQGLIFPQWVSLVVILISGGGLAFTIGNYFLSRGNTKSE